MRDSTAHTNIAPVPAFLDLPDRQIYYVVHPATKCRTAAVLICGPALAERERAYPTIVAWSRVLADIGMNVMRFDYSGIGESTGSFESANFSRWLDDASACAAHFQKDTVNGPFVLQGIRAGALIAAKLFASGIGDRLLLWAPPQSAEALLWDTLRRTLAVQMMANPTAPRQTREQQVAALEATGQPMNVDGYFWTIQLWRDAKNHVLLSPSASERRPWRAIQIKRGTGISPVSDENWQSVGADPFWEQSPQLLPGVDSLFRASLDWFSELNEDVGTGENA